MSPSEVVVVTVVTVLSPYGFSNVTSLTTFVELLDADEWDRVGDPSRLNVVIVTSFLSGEADRRIPVRYMFSNDRDGDADRAREYEERVDEGR